MASHISGKVILPTLGISWWYTGPSVCLATSWGGFLQQVMHKMLEIPSKRTHANKKPDKPFIDWQRRQRALGEVWLRGLKAP